VSCNPQIAPEHLAPFLYMYSGEEAIRHIFRVASSLDSMVVGEPQILGQLKDAFDDAMLHKTTGVVLNKVFKKAISVAKRVRTETRIAENAVSISFAAVELAKKIFGQLQNKAVLLIGAGDMAELAARHFIGSGVRTVVIANRSHDRAVELAKELGGVPIPLEEFRREMVETDIVLCSAGAPHYLIGPEEVSQVIQARKNRPIFLIDISVPRNIDPVVNQIDNVFLYDIDDLQLSVETNIRTREQEALKAEEIISQEIEIVNRWLKSLEVVPTIVALREKAEEIRKGEMEKVLSKWETLTDEQKGALEALTGSIINKLLHAPLVVLKQEADSSEGGMYLEAIRRLFNLDGDLKRCRRSEPDMKEDKDA
ncbi:MAG TPA: glutamyl-tRNA reductase, partial [Nitrospiria bacterium]|nr:glutamyl-tRNA reductase [Nitrospiria bacterium]